MDEFARRPAGDRLAFIEEAASRRDLTPIIVEKDFWVCWTLRRLTATPDLKGHAIFKGGTSLSKAYGIIQRFSEDIDLTLCGDAPLIVEVASPMEPGISGKARERRTRALRTAARAYVETVAMPVLGSAIAAALDSAEGWSLELDPEDRDGQTLLFNYPRAGGPDEGGREAGYVKPRIKLEYGARGEPDPSEARTIVPYLAEDFPDELPDSKTEVSTLSVLRTFWEKATLLHALRHKGAFREGLSRHYYDLVMLDRAGVTDEALSQPDLLAAVVRNKSLMFPDRTASYETAVIGQMRLFPSEMTEAFMRDYAAMADMFMAPPPSDRELLEAIEALERRMNAAAA